MQLNRYIYYYAELFVSIESSRCSRRCGCGQVVKMSIYSPSSLVLLCPASRSTLLAWALGVIVSWKRGRLSYEILRQAPRHGGGALSIHDMSGSGDHLQVLLPIEWMMMPAFYTKNCVIGRDNLMRLVTDVRHTSYETLSIGEKCSCYLGTLFVAEWRLQVIFNAFHRIVFSL